MDRRKRSNTARHTTAPAGTKATRPAAARRRFELLAWIAYLAIGLVGLITRAIYLFDAARNDPFFFPFSPGTDMKTHHDWAISIAGGDWLGRSQGVFHQAPLYPYFVAIFYALFGPHPAIVYAAQQLLGIATALLICRLGQRLFSLKVGFLAGLLWVLYGVGMVYEVKLLLTSLLAFLTVGSVLLLLRADEKGRIRDWVLAGGALAGSILGRPNALPLVLLLLPWRLLQMGRWGRRRGLLQWAVVAGTVALIILPVSVRNRAIGGRWELISDNGGWNFFVGNNPQAVGAFQIAPLAVELKQKFEGQPVPWSREARRFIREEPGHWLELTAKKTRMFWHAYEVPNNTNTYAMRRYSLFLRLPWISFGLISVFSLLGMGLCVRMWRKLLLLYLFVLTLAGTIILFFVVDRFRLPASALLCPFAAYGIGWLVGRFRERDVKRLATALPVSAALAVLVFAFNPLRTKPIDRMWSMNYARALNAVGRQAEAVREAETVRAGGQFTATDYTFMGELYSDSGDYDKAAECFMLALEGDPASSAALTDWQEFSQEMAQRPGAVETIERWARRFPGRPQILVSLGNALAAQGRQDEALAQFQAAVRLAPRDPDGWYRLACLLAIEGKSADALEALAKAIDLGGDAIRAGAAADSDLASLRGMEEFRKLIEGGTGSTPVR